ncbi:restriction endonuclease subunit S, partial [Helicobacter winghamensis]
HRQNKTLESLALTLFRHYFIDNPNRNEWEEKPLSEIAEIGIGRTPPRKERHWFSTDSRDIKWISIKDMEEKIFIVNTSEFLTMEAIRKFRIPLIPPNTILLSFKMTLGRVSITTENMLSNEAIAHFNLYSEYRLFTEYLYCFLKTFKYETLGSTSSIVTAINSTLIKSINIRIPDRKIIVEFSMIAKGFFDKIYNNTKQIQNLQAMRDMMLGKIFN